MSDSPFSATALLAEMNENGDNTGTHEVHFTVDSGLAPYRTTAWLVDVNTGKVLLQEATDDGKYRICDGATIVGIDLVIPAPATPPTGS